MSWNWNTCSNEVKELVSKLLNETIDILKGDFVGFYIHGSLAMGGFNPNRSDIDVLVVTKNELTIEVNKKLAELVLRLSSAPYPIEISILQEGALRDWQHPCPYEFHYSEDWRERFELALAEGDGQEIAAMKGKDPDLAAHITITNHRGICLEGPPIGQVFPTVEREEYISSILYDFDDCIKDITYNPVYCVLNLVRVYWYLQKGIISSKEEAGKWGSTYFQDEVRKTIQKAYEQYAGVKDNSFEKEELYSVRDYFLEKVKELVT